MVAADAYAKKAAELTRDMLERISSTQSSTGSVGVVQVEPRARSKASSGRRWESGGQDLVFVVVAAGELMFGAGRAIRVQTYRKIVEQIRTALVGMVAEVRETPTQEALDRAVVYILTGDRDAQLTFSSQQR